MVPARTIEKSVQTITNSPEAFSGGTIRIGSDNYSGRNFNGSMDEVAVFNKSLSEAQIQGLFLVGSGLSGVPAYIASDISATPTNTSNLFPGPNSRAVDRRRRGCSVARISMAGRKRRSVHQSCQTAAPFPG